MLWDNLAIVDLETTGGMPHRDRVIEVGIIVVDKNKPTRRYSQLLNPQTWLPPEISILTGIQRPDLEKQPTFAEVAEEIFGLLNGRLFVAHNARFDYGFLKHEFERLGVEFNSKMLCSARLSRALFPQEHGHSLDALIARFNLKVKSRHRALDDALAVWDFFKRLKKVTAADQLEKATKILIKTQSLPPFIKKEQIEQIPHCPGIYIFYDEAGTPLYVGKSVDLKSRVLGHFYDDLTLPKDFRLKASIADIETRTSAGELDALLTESRLVKELKPLFNSQLRNRAELCVARMEKNRDGYLTLIYDHVNKLMLEDLPTLAGVFKSRKQAREAIQTLAEDHDLCWYLCGLEKSKPCFGYHLEKCRGACVGEETPLSYNLRFQEALLPHTITSWPFPGAVVIQEANELTGQSKTHVFDQWCHLGSSISEEEFNTMEENNTQEYVFDLDVYHIVKRFITKHPGRVTPLEGQQRRPIHTR